MKKLLYALIGLVVIVVAALFIVPPMIANSVIKPKITAGIEEAIGRKAEIGDLSLSVLPSIKVQLRDLKIANAEGMPTPNMVSLGTVDLQLQILPLIGSSVQVDRLVVSGLAVFLEKDADGRANWVFETAAAKGEGEPEPAPSGEGGLPISGLSLGDVRIEGARFSYIDLASGQTIEASDFNLKASLPSLEGKLAVDGGLTVNDQAIKLALGIDSPGSLLSGNPASLAARVESALLSLNSDLSLQQQPQPAVDGSANLDIGSVGALLEWLQQPLPAEQPDPGPLKVAAAFKTEGTKVILEQAEITGDALDAKASGSFEQAGEKIAAVLRLEGGVLDIDRYLPPPAPGAPKAAPDKPKAAERQDPLDALPDDPIDLAPLRNVEADIQIAMGGIKAAGYEVGRIAFSAVMADGKLTADLTELALYGGGVTGKLGLDASGDALGLESDFAIDQVDLGRLSAVATEGDPPVAGVASGSLTAKASGRSPRALAKSVQGGLVFKLGKIDLKAAKAAALSGVDITLDLPGIAQPPSLKGSLVYNKRKVDLDVGLDPLDKVLAGESFALKANVASDLLKVSYNGSVQQQPLPGLDGQFDLDSPSVGKLVAWLGQPLDPKQPDPGPLKVLAVLKAEGERVVLQEAKIQGKALDASATGSIDVSGEVKKVVLDIKAGMLDVDAYLPPPETAPADAPAAAAPAQGAAPANALAGIPDDPIDLSGLRGAEADVKLALAGLKAVGFELGQTDIKLALKGGKLALEIPSLKLYGGGITGRLDLDGSGDVLGLATDIKVASLAVGDLAKAAGVEPAPLSGVMTADIKAQAQGKSPRALVEALKAELALQLVQASLAALPEAEIGKLDAKLSLPGLDQATTGTANLTLNGKPVAMSFDVNSPKKAMAGETFALKANVTSDLLKANVDGAVQQQPLPGLDGDVGVDVASVGQLASWLGKPLPEGQPDPGPLTLRASLAADGNKVALKQATITGKEAGGQPAAKATASGSFDGSGEVARFDGKVNVERLDLNAFLPPQEEEKKEAAATGEGAPAQKGWSEEPIDLSALRQAEGDLKLTTGEVLFRQVRIQKTTAAVNLAGGVLNASVSELQLSPGQIAAAAVVDGSGKGAALSYNMSLQGVESKPFLNSFAGIDWLSGKLEVRAKGAASGLNQKQIVGTLNGDGAFKFLDGAVEGFDLAGTLRNAGQLGMAPAGTQKPKTDFTELSGSYTVTNGLVQNSDLKMLAPLVRVNGAGKVPLPPRTLDYRVEAKLVGSLEGQGGQEALAGIPIPVHAHGPWDNLTYDIDWASVFAAAALDPSRIANMPANLKDAASGFGVPLIAPGAEGGEGGIGEALQGILGGGSQTQQPESEASEGPTPTTEQPSQQEDEGEPLKKLLKGLF